MQWPAMAVTVYASWLLTSATKRRRCAGFVGFLVSNVLWTLWTLWALPAGVYAVVLLQVCLALLNLRGLQKNQ